MEAFLGTTWDVFLGITVILAGGAAVMMGQAIAQTWRPSWQVVIYGFLMAVGTRFLVYALFDGSMLSPSGYLADSAVLIGIGLLAFRVTRTHLILRQYPWLYEPAGLFNYKER
jgi:branched-chain amino acid transport system ATP-binding protein